MSTDYILVHARIRMLPSSESGRTTPISGSYRPNHNFFGPDNRNMTIGFIEIPKGKELLPGEVMDLRIKLWNWSDLDREIYPGREWRIQEGAKVVGTGTVIAIIGSES